MNSNIKRIFLDRIKDRLGSRLISAYSLRQVLFVVLEDKDFTDSLKELNRTWLELGRPEYQDLWPIVYRRSDLPIIRDYGIDWNPYLSSEFIESGSLVYGPDILKADTKALLKARLMICNQWGASYEGLPDFIKPSEDVFLGREGILKDMKLLLHMKGKAIPHTESELLDAFLDEYREIPEELKSDLRLIVFSPGKVNRHHALFIYLLYNEHIAKILLKNRDKVS